MCKRRSEKNEKEAYVITMPIFCSTLFPVRSCADAVVSAKVVADDCSSSPSSEVKLVRCVQLQYAMPLTSSVLQYVQPSLLHVNVAVSQ